MLDRRDVEGIDPLPLEEYVGRTILWNQGSGSGTLVQVMEIRPTTAIVRNGEWEYFEVPHTDLEWIIDPFVPQLYKGWNNGPCIMRTSPTAHQCRQYARHFHMKGGSK